MWLGKMQRLMLIGLVSIYQQRRNGRKRLVADWWAKNTFGVINEQKEVADAIWSLDSDLIQPLTMILFNGIIDSRARSESINKILQKT
jgi:hypothetical protein